MATAAYSVPAAYPRRRVAWYALGVRGLATAVVILIVNLMGLGLGSLLPGLFTDYLFANELKVGNSIALTIALSSIAGLTAVLLTLRPYRRHYASMHSQP